jgi:CheY-like chemotaxis protein
VTATRKSLGCAGLKVGEILGGRCISLMERESVVLIVDDDENDLLLMQRALAKASIFGQVMVVRAGEEAIDYLSGEGKYGDRKLYPLPSLMLLDLKMPMVDGFDVLAWCRERGHGRSLPIVVMSSSNHDSDIARAMALGATSFRTKPNDFQQLVAIARDVLRGPSRSCQL